MTRYGVPDDDMRDSQQPPTWDPAYDERDLEAVLSGETESVPEALRPVAGTLAALRGAPAAAELAGEDSARAAFRAVFPAHPLAGGARAGGAERGAVPEHTLILPSAEPSQHRVPRHRRVRPRRASGHRRWPAVLVGSAAVAVAAVLAIAFTGIIHFPVTLSSFGRNSASGSLTPQGTGKTSGSQGVEGTGSTTRPSTGASPAGTPAPAAQGSATLCREFYAFLTHQEPPSARRAEKALLRQLRELAGAHQSIMTYCRSYVGSPLHSKNPWPSASPVPTGLAGRKGHYRAAAGRWKPGSRGSWIWTTLPTPGQVAASQPAASSGPTPAASGS